MKKQLLFILLMLLPLAARAFSGEVVIDGIKYFLLSKDQSAEVRANSYSGDITIPETVEYEDFTYNVTSIGSSAFQNCRGLTSVTIGNSVTSIGADAFNGCSQLTAVHISDIAAWCGITFANTYSNPLNYAHHLYLNEEEITNLNIPDGVTSINDDAFFGCSGLTSVTIGNSVTSIGAGAFAYCSGLTSVSIPNFVTSIGGAAFSHCSGLTSVTIGNSVTSIGAGAFNGCSHLTSVHISDIAAWCNISFDERYSNPLVYAHHLYLNEEEIINLNIPDGVTSIRSLAFSHCSGLTSVTIGNSVTSIGADAFENCI